MTPSDCPEQSACAPIWQAYVASGATRAERGRRLEQAPEPLRRRIESHVRTVFAIAAYHKRRAAEKARA
jgi:hypothetical protein